jgi:tetratricopeptide (TPR) repeat protein
MNVKDYTFLLNKPDAISKKQTEELGAVLNEFPYFQSARALRLKGLYDQNSFKYNYALKVTAAHTTDRSVLFDFITSATFTSVQNQFHEDQTQNTLYSEVLEEENISSSTATEAVESDSVSEKTVLIEKTILNSIETTNLPSFEEPETSNPDAVTLTLDDFEPIAQSPILSTSDLNENTVVDESSVSENKDTEEIAQVQEEIAENIEQAVENDEISVFIPQEPAEEAHDTIVDIPVADVMPSIDEEQEEEPQEDTPFVFKSVKNIEENLEIGKPIDFSINETHSFQEWLQLARTKPIDRSKVEAITALPNETKDTAVSGRVPTADDPKKKKEEIINKFIETNPKISPIRQTPITPAVQLNAKEEDNSYLMTETLARVYLEQKKYTKAIQAYEILILKYPEKISFFADRISDIKILQQNNNNN